MAGAPDFWEDREKAQEVISRMNFLRGRIDSVLDLEERLSEVEVLLELGEEEEDEEALREAQKISRRLRRDFDSLSLSLMLQGKYDANNAILALHPGAGGTESQDWTEMLLRMYNRWAEKRRFEVEILDQLPGDEAGIKSVTLLVKGPYAYGYLRSERGVHRLVRISPFDTGGRRHTSFASVDVLPEVEESQEVAINPDELKIDTFRSKGAGGQHVNTTDSAVRITHLPTGIVVTCQNERSQHSNRDRAMRILRARLADKYQQEQEESVRQLRGEQKEIAWGSQIRSYVLHPYTMAKDHRTQVEVGNVQGVLDGDLDGFMDAYLRHGLK